MSHQDLIAPEFAGHDPAVLDDVATLTVLEQNRQARARESQEYLERYGVLPEFATHRGSRRFVSRDTRALRRMRAHMRTRAGTGGTAKHHVKFITPQGPRMSPPIWSFGELVSMPYEGHTTQPRPWTKRKRNRARNKRAAAGRRANRGTARS